VRFENNYVNHASHAFVFQGANGNVWWSGNTVANSTAKFYGENNAVLASAPLETVFTPSYGFAKRSVANLPVENPLHAGVGGRWGSMPTYDQAFGQSNKAPTVSVTAPAAGASVVTSAKLTLGATAADGDGKIASVAFYVGRTLVGSATTAPYTATVSGLPAGTHSIVAVATDNSGLKRTSEFVTISVSPEAPVGATQKTGDRIAVRVVWTDLRGEVVQDQIQWLDPDDLSPTLPQGAVGMLVARIHLPNGAMVGLRRFAGMRD
jgi:hypothetical protein